MMMNYAQRNDQVEGGPVLQNYHLTYRGNETIREWESARDLPFRIEWDVVLKEKQLGRDTEVGLGIAHYFPVADARAKSIDAFDAFRSVSVDCEAVYEGIFDRQTSELKQSLRGTLACDLAGPDVLVINAVVLSPDHRGSGLGLAILKQFIERFAPDAGLVAMAPTFWLPGFWVPTNVEERWMGPFDRGGGLTDPGQADRLCSHLEKLGFVRMPHSEVLALCTTSTLPAMKELCPRLLD
jgi:GNAT superfamily N-acetyltransferase